MTQRGVARKPRRGRGARAVAVAVLMAGGLVAGGAQASPHGGAPAQPPTSWRTAPDAQVVFARYLDDRESYEIWTMDRAGGHQRRLTWNDTADHDPAWSPDGERIAWARYVSPNNTGRSDIWVMDADGSDKQRLTTLRAGVEGPTWSPDGQQIAFENYERIWVINADGTGLHPISPEGSFDHDPDWSPDGQWIAFSATGPTTIDLFAMRPDGTDRHLLAATPGTQDYDPAWSPDGRRIAYTVNKSFDPVGWHVSWMRADGTGHHIAVDVSSQAPAWAPGGRTLVFDACHNTICGLHTSTIRGEAVTPLGHRGHYDVQPDLRPRWAG